MKTENVSEQLLYTVTRIWVDGGQRGGTGILFNINNPRDASQSIPFLVTHHSVLANAEKLLLTFAKSDGLGRPTEGDRLRIEFQIQSHGLFTNADLEVAALPIGGLLNEALKSEIKLYFKTLSADLIPSDDAISSLSIMENVYLLGFANQLNLVDNDIPVIKHGITATPCRLPLGGKPHFLVDTDILKGMEGGPVLLVNQGGFSTEKGFTIGSRILLLGMILGSFTHNGDSIPGLTRVLDFRRVKFFLDGIVGTITKPEFQNK
jgi:hypothetical protein